VIRRTPVKKRRAKPRRGPLRDKIYRRWVSGQFCAVSANYDWEKREPGDMCSGSGNTPKDPAHTENNGMGSKGPDSSCAPLCRKHHREYDAGRAAFEQKYGVDMKAIAAQLWARYQQEKAA
jgi:hypothetical protein